MAAILPVPADAIDVSDFMAEKSLVNDVAEMLVVGVLLPEVVDVPVDVFFELPQAASRLPARTRDSPIPQPVLKFTCSPFGSMHHRTGRCRTRDGSLPVLHRLAEICV